MARVNYWGVERRCSLVVEHLLRKQEVAGSIPVVGFYRPRLNDAKRAVQGFEPWTSRTQTENHTTRPNGH